MKNTMKRFLSLALALFMVLSLMPQITLGASAEEVEQRTIYLNAGGNSLWDQSGAWFAAWVWGNNQSAWYTFTSTNDPGVYKIEIPADSTGMKINRMASGATEPSWTQGDSGYWNQTGDLSIPSDKDLFTITSWDGGSWSVYTYVAPTFYLRGSMNSWGADDTNKMTESNGVYTYTTTLDAGSYQYKVGNADWSMGYPDQNASLTVENDGSTVTFTFNASTKEIKVDVVAPHVHDWANGVCKNACGETHEHTETDWTAADCDTPKTCNVCGETEGEAKGHDWENGVCKNECGETHEHAEADWAAADCDTPQTCSVCGKTEGEANGHSFGDNNELAKCSVCGTDNLDYVAPVVAKVGDTEYASVKAALDAAIEAGEGTVTIVSEDGYAATGDRVDVTKAGTYTITGGNGIMLPGIYMQSVGNVHLVIEDAYVSAGKLIAGSGSMLDSGSSITVKDSVIDAGEFSYDGSDGASWWTMWGDAVVEITDSTIGANAELGHTGKNGITDVPYGQNESRMHFGTSGTATITNSTFISGFFQVSDHGVITLNGSTLYVGGGLNVGYTKGGNDSWTGGSSESASGAATINVNNSKIYNIGWGNGGAGNGLQVGGTYAGELKLTNSTVDFSKGFPSAIHSNGVLNMTGSTLKVNTLTVNKDGKINITVVDIEEGTSVKLIEQTAENAASLKDVVTITNDLPAGTSISYADGDVTLTKQKAVATIGTTRYYSLADALKAAQDGDTVTLVWSEGDAPIVMKGVVDNGKTVTITGTATVDWTKGWLSVGRDGNGNGKLIFKDATIKSNGNGAEFGLNISGAKNGVASTQFGTVEMIDSDIELDYMVNRNVLIVDNTKLTVKNGFYVHGRNAEESVSGTNEIATVTVKNGSVVEVKHNNGTGIGGESYGVLNIENATFKAMEKGFAVREGSNVNISGTSTVVGNFAVAGEINVAEDANVTFKLVDNMTLTAPIEVKDSTVTITADKAVTITTTVTDVFTAGEGGTLTLGENVKVESNTSVLYANGGTINVEGAEISVSGASYNAVAVDAGGTLNVKSGSISQTDDRDTVSVTKGTVNVSGGTVHSENNSAIAALAGATVNITDGTVSTNATANKAAAYAKNGGKVVVNGGTVKSENESATSFALVAGAKGTVEVKSGTVSGTAGSVLAHEAASANVTITGGTFNGEVAAIADAKMAVSGGTFDQAVAYEYCADGFIPTKNGDSYGVKAGQYTAQVGEDLFETLAEAVAAAETGDTVKLLADITLVGDSDPETVDGIVVIDKSVTITADTPVVITNKILDLFTAGANGTLTLGENVKVESNTSVLYANGGTINVEGAEISVDGSKYNAVAVDAGGELNVKSGSISQTDDRDTVSVTKGTVNVSGGTVHSANNSAIAALAGATVNITGGTVSTNATANKAAAYAKNGGKVVVDGGTVVSENEDAASFALVAGANGTVEVKSGNVNGTAGSVLAHESADAKVTISGGTFTGEVAAIEDAEMAVSGGTFDQAVAYEYCADGFIPTKNGDSYGVKAGQYTAQVGEDLFETLAEAVAAAENGETVKLLDDITLVGDSDPETVDGIVVSGKSVTITADAPVVITNKILDLFTAGEGGTLTLGANLTVNSDTSVLYVNGGTINVDGAEISVSGASYNAVAVAAGGELNVKSGSISQTDDRDTVSVTKGTVNVSGGTVHSENNSAIAALAGATVNITGGTVSTNATANKAAAYAKNGGKVVVNGGTVVSENEDAASFALVAGANGTVEVKSGNVNGTAGSVLAHEAASANVTITGGTFTGEVAAIEDAKMEVSGGTFDQAVPENCCALGYSPAELGDGKYGVELGYVLNVNTGVNYGTIETALDKASEGDTLKLLQAHEEDLVVINKDVTLDLNGQTLTTDYLAAFSGSHVIDSNTEKGLLIVPQNKVMLQADNKQMPVYTGTGYVFAALNLSYEQMNEVSGLKFQTKFKPSFGNVGAEKGSIATNYILNKNAEAHGVKILVRLSWMNGNSLVKQDFEFSEELVNAVYGAADGRTWFTLGVTSLASEAAVTAQVLVISDTGVEALSNGWTYSNGTMTQINP